MSVKQVKSLLGKLGDYCVNTLDAAAGFASARAHYEITIEHLCIKLLEDGTGDMAHILRAYQVDMDRLWQGLLQALNTNKAGNTGKPGFSPLMLQWLEQAWLNASLCYGHSAIRSGDLLDALLELAPRLPGNHFALLDDIPLQELRENFASLTKGSAESVSAAGSTAGQSSVRTGTPAAENGALSQFSVDLTARARDGAIDLVLGRDNEVRQMVDVLSRRRKNNPILVGDPGVGKTALVEGLALRIVAGDVPEELRHVAVHILDMGLLQAGAGVKGEFEKRLKNLIDEVKQSPVPIILFVDEAHTLIGAGAEAGSGDAANLLKPALARGELRMIAATTWSEYKKYFERDAALVRRFQLIKVDEPDQETAIMMLGGLKSYYERHHKVLITDAALRAAVELSSRYIIGRQLPDKAIDLLDTAAARVRLAQSTPPAVIERLEARRQHIQRRLQSLREEEAQGLPVSSSELGELEAQEREVTESLSREQMQWKVEMTLVQALTRQRQEAVAFLSDPGSAQGQKARAQLGRARSDMLATQGGSSLVPTEVNRDVVASVVSDWTGVPVGSMLSDLAGAMLEFEDSIGQQVMGQDQALARIGSALRIKAAGFSRVEAPLGVFLLVGPSGVGKTETARAIADYLFGGARFLIHINMSEYKEAHTVSQLKGSPPGYVGYGEGGVLTEAVRQRPYSVVLLDEVEKAHPDVMSLFYQAFDQGLMRDGEGREIDFRNTVILLTSNLAAEKILSLWQEAVVSPPVEDPKKAKKGSRRRKAAEEVPEGSRGAVPLSMEKMEREIQPELLGYFPQALLARMQVVPYVPLDSAALKRIVATKLDKVAGRILKAHDLKLRCTAGVIDHLSALCERPELGARHVDAIIERQLLPSIARQLLAYMVADDMPDALSLGLDEAGEIVCDFLTFAADEDAPAVVQASGS